MSFENAPPSPSADSRAIITEAKAGRSRQNKQNWQLTLADLIDRLPRLSVELHRQLELDLDNYPEVLVLLSPAMVQGETAPN